MAGRQGASVVSRRDEVGNLALDFVNTLDWRDRAQPVERLGGWPDLIQWARLARAILPREASAFAAEARASPHRARAHFREALRLREAMSRIFRAWLARRAPDTADLALLNARLRARAPRRELAASGGGGFVWRSFAAQGAPWRLLELLAGAAAELLTSPELEHLRLCEGAGCGWLFLDSSPNRRRRWCSMASCGNRAKARRHYALRRQSAASPTKSR